MIDKFDNEIACIALMKIETKFKAWVNILIAHHYPKLGKLILE